METIGKNSNFGNKVNSPYATPFSSSFAYKSFRMIGVEMLETMMSRITAVK